LTKIQGVGAPNLESLDFVKVIEDKKELLEEFDSVVNEEQNITFKNLLYTFGVFFAVLGLFVAKIAIANQVYKKSISIHKLERELEFLKVQRKDIVEKLQEKRYSVEVLNDL